MTREEAKAEINKVFEPAFANYIITALTEGETPSEHRTGKWVKHNTGHSIYYDCSLCSELAKNTETADAIVWELSKYCPECGAKMEGANE